MNVVATYAMLIYGILLIFGGFMGYRAGSTVSLIAGGSFGALSIVFFILALTLWPYATLAELILSVLVMMAMARRAVTKGLVGPAGITMAFSLIVLVLQLVALASTKN